MNKIFTFFIIIFPVYIHSQQLVLDASYANGGINQTGLFSDNIFSNDTDGIADHPYFMADNSILVPYSLNPQLVNTPLPTIGIKKYLENGSLDTTFGTNGTALFIASDYHYRFAVNQVAVQQDGKIVLCGRQKGIGGFIYDYKMFACRFNANGTQDNTFGTNGLALINIHYHDSGDSNDERLVDLTVDNQNRITAVGYSAYGFGTEYFNDAIAIRLLENGTLDSSFATNGILHLELPGQDKFSSIYPTVDNNIIILGNTSQPPATNNMMLAKIDQSGTLINTFGDNGIAQIDFGYASVAIKLFFEPNDKMMVVGYKGSAGGNGGISFARLNPDATFDTTFSGDGKNKIVISVPGHDPIGNEFYPGLSSANIAKLPDNKYILASSVRRGNNYDFAIARIDEDTTLDSTFATNGVYTSPDTVPFDWVRALHVQNDGKLVVLITSALFKYSNFSMLNVQDFDDKSNLQIFPNPSTDVLKFSAKVQNATISDATGKMVGTYSNVEQIDINKYSAGIYILKLKLQDGNVIFRKVLKY